MYTGLVERAVVFKARATISWKQLDHRDNRNINTTNICDPISVTIVVVLKQQTQPTQCNLAAPWRRIAASPTISVLNLWVSQS